MSDAPWTDLIESARAGRLLVFCGSGVSSLAPSSAPSWWGFYEKVVNTLERTLRAGFPEYSGRLDTKALLDQWATQQIADLVIHGFAGPTFTELVKLLDPALTNENHESLAALSEHGHVRGLVTTNFDTLLERAIAARGGDPRIIIPSIPSAGRVGLKAIPVVKLHGSAVDAQTIAEAMEVKLRLGSLTLGPEIEAVLDGADLLVLGFGGWDLAAGIVKTFFDRADARGGAVFWLYRSSRPSIPHPVVSKIRWVKGSLPETLRRVTAELGVDAPAPRPEAPPVGPPRTRLDEAVERWGNKLHIGRWAAMAFFLDSLPVEASGDLFEFAAARLRAEEERLRAGTELRLDDLTMAVACSKLAVQALRRGRFDDAELIGRLAVRLFESFQAGVTAEGHEQIPEARREYLMNTSSAYANLAHVYLIKGEVDQAVEMTTGAVVRAYEGRQLGSLLLALNNLVHYRDKMSRIRESLALTMALSRLAEREGLLQVAVEAGTLACLYHAVRNEVHLALRAWERVERLMSLSSSSSLESIHRMLRADLHLRTGDVRVALESLAEMTERSPHSVTIHLAAAELSGRLAVLGFPRRFEYDLDIERAAIEPALQRIERELTAAASSGKPVFQGQLFSLYKSSGVDDDDRRLLFWLGAAEFTGDVKTRTAIAFRRCERLIRQSEFQELLWSAENLLASPGLEPLARADAHCHAAEALAQLGRHAQVDAHLEAARREEDSASAKASPHRLELSLWHAIQSRRWDAAARLAEELGGRMAAMERGADAGRMLLLQIATWGEEGRAVVAALTRGASGAGLDFGLDPYLEASPPGEPWRRFAGALRVDPSAMTHVAILQEAERLFAEDKIEDALRKVEDVLQQTKGDLPEPLLGGMLGVQVAGFSKLVPWRKASQAMDRTRPGLLSTGRFSALAQLEGAFLLEALGEDASAAAAPLHWPVGYLADLAADPRAATELRFYAAALEAKRGNLSGFTPRWAEAGAFASYYGLSRLEHLIKTTQAWAEAASRTGAAAGEDAAESLLEAVPKARDHGEVRTLLRRVRRAVPDTLGRLEGQVANWLLNAGRYRAAIAWYARAAAKLERLGRLHELSIAYAGSARARTRMGQPEEAVRLFDAALTKLGEHPGRADLLRGRGAAYFQVAMQEGRTDAEARLDDAVRSFQEAIGVPGVALSDRAYALLGLARVLGMQGRQQEALDRFDEAVAALTHLGSPLAGQLLQIRPLVAEGRWEVLGVA